MHCTRTPYEYILVVSLHVQFDFEKCKFKVEKSKEGTGRVVMWRMGVINSFTMEVLSCSARCPSPHLALICCNRDSVDSDFSNLKIYSVDLYI